MLACLPAWLKAAIAKILPLLSRAWLMGRRDARLGSMRWGRVGVSSAYLSNVSVLPFQQISNEAETSRASASGNKVPACSGDRLQVTPLRSLALYEMKVAGFAGRLVALHGNEDDNRNNRPDPPRPTALLGPMTGLLVVRLTPIASNGAWRTWVRISMSR